MLVLALPVLLLVLAGAPPAQIAGVPLPPEGAHDAGLTKAATERASAEMKTALARLEKDGSLSADQKREIKSKIARLRIAVITTPKSLDEIVTFYEREMPNVTFIFAERDILGDLQELSRESGLKIEPEVARAWTGKTGRSARWSREDKGLEIDVEDTLIDPRDGKISRTTIVLVTTIAD